MSFYTKTVSHHNSRTTNTSVHLIQQTKFHAVKPPEIYTTNIISKKGKSKLLFWSQPKNYHLHHSEMLGASKQLQLGLTIRVTLTNCPPEILHKYFCFFNLRRVNFTSNHRAERHLVSQLLCNSQSEGSLMVGG